ncbi:hypothetical protein ACFVXC_02780 [Streptomyces sp. NPDC058257]
MAAGITYHRLGFAPGRRLGPADGPLIGKLPEALTVHPAVPTRPLTT